MANAMNTFDNCLEESWCELDWRCGFVGSATIVLGCLGSHAIPPGLEDLSNRRLVPFVSVVDNHECQERPGIFISDSDTESLNDELAPFHLQLVELHFKSQLDNLSLPPAWTREGTPLPLSDCLEWSLQVLCRLFDNYGLIPYKIMPTKEGGVFAAYKNPLNGNVLRVEVDNELDVVAVVSDGQSILESCLLEDDDMERSLINTFDSQLA